MWHRNHPLKFWLSLLWCCLGSLGCRAVSEQHNFDVVVNKCQETYKVVLQQLCMILFQPLFGSCFAERQQGEEVADARLNCYVPCCLSCH